MSGLSGSLRRDSTFAVVVLTAMNLLNYIDRWAPSAVKPLFQSELKLTDEESSLPFSAFVIVYMLASPVFGSLAERGRRPVLLAAGVALWSVATAAGALATGFASFLIARAAVGVGEAAYATIAPALIADHYAPDKRNKVLTAFYVAIPVGSALGFVLGGAVGDAWGWRAAFLICGLPGIAVAAIALLLVDPPRGRFDEKKEEPPPWREALAQLRHNPRYLFTVGGYVAVTFATGGIGEWFPTVLHRSRGFDLAEAGSIAGTATVVGGLGGTILGGVIAEVLVKKGVKEAYMWTSALSLIPALALAGYAFYFVDGYWPTMIALALCQLFLWMYNGPVNTLLVNSVGPGLRARAFALSIFSIHAFGDVISPPIIGKVSSATGSLPFAVGLVLLALGGGVIIWAFGAWRLGRTAAAPAPSTT
jgi:MFS family permease